MPAAGRVRVSIGRGSTRSSDRPCEPVPPPSSRLEGPRVELRGSPARSERPGWGAPLYVVGRSRRGSVGAGSVVVGAAFGLALFVEKLRQARILAAGCEELLDQVFAGNFGHGAKRSLRRACRAGATVGRS